MKIIGFRQVHSDQPQLVFKRYSLEKASLAVVFLDFQTSQSSSAKMHLAEQWVKTQPDIELIKITKREAFVQTYLDRMGKGQPTFFISSFPVDKLQEEPLLVAYRQKLEEEGRLQEILSAAKDNIDRIRFIVLQDAIETLNRLNFFHPGVALITSQPELVIEQIKAVLASKPNLQSMPSTSSINSEDVELFRDKKQLSVGEGISLLSPNKNQSQEQEVWQAKSQTPGVGTYTLAVEGKPEGVVISPSKSRSQQMAQWQTSNLNPGPGTYN